jgi:hypothetical protein
MFIFGWQNVGTLASAESEYEGRYWAVKIAQWPSFLLASIVPEC